MVRVLRHDCPPEESSLTAQEKLEVRYGFGKFLPEKNVYLCALPARLRQSLEEINSAPERAPISTSISRWLLNWLSDVKAVLIDEECTAEGRRAMRELDKAITEVLNAMEELNKEWAECVRSAAAPGRPLLLVTPPSPPQVQQELADSVKSALSRGWELKYDDPLGVVDYLKGVVDGYMAEWALGQYHAAWTMVLQSSGWGKSRSIQELATKGFHVAYVSFMRRGATGIPGRSGFADVLTSIESDTRDPRCIAAWVVAILSQIKDASPEIWRQTQESFVGEVSQRYKELREDVTRTVPHQSPSPGEQWRPDGLRRWIRLNLSSILKGESERENGEPEKKIVFCLDEAASLFKDPSTDEPSAAASNEPSTAASNGRSTPFLAFRRFFSAIPQSMKLFGLVADTAGKLLGMVFPQRMFDPSARGVDPTTMFFQPVWMVGSALREPEKLRRLMSEQKDVAAVSEDFTKELFKMGRPLWRALLDNDAKDGFVHLDDAVKFASQKLLDGVAPVTLLSNKLLITEAMATAIIGVVAGLEVAAWADLAQHMVAGHMRSVSHVSGDRERVFTGDVIEPILGEAAAHVLANEEVLLRVLELMGGVLKQALVVEGPRGEIVGRLLLVLAMHHCCRLRMSRSHETYSHPVPLGSFLSVLCGRTVTAEGFIFFNRFMFLNRREIDGNLLLFCFVCGFAIIPQRNQAGFDVLLPWLVPGPDGKHQLLPDRMRAVPVQIRNRQAAAVKAEKLTACLSSWTLNVKEEESPEVQGQGRAESPGVQGQGQGESPGMQGQGRGESSGVQGQGRGESPGVQGQGRGESPGVQGQGRGESPGVQGRGRGESPGVQGQGRGESAGVQGQGRGESSGVQGQGRGESPEVQGRGKSTKPDKQTSTSIPDENAFRYSAPPERAAAKLSEMLEAVKLRKYFDGGRAPKKPRVVAKDVSIGRVCGLYLHVKGEAGVKHEVDIIEDSKVLVLRGVRFPFLKERVSAELEKMCHAFFKVEDELKVDQQRGKIVHHNFVNCFKLRKDENSKDGREPDLLLEKPL